MASVTADRTSSIQIRMPIYVPEPAREAEVIERYMRWFAGPRTLSSPRPAPDIHKLVVFPPTWLRRLHQRIYDSIIPDEVTEENDGRWLSRESAKEAISFFNKTADLLPEEPFIYGTYSGDLVAEFKAEHGTLTSIVSPTFVLLFTVVGDEQPIETKITDRSEARDEVEKVARLLNKGRHGAVDAFK